MRFDDLVREDKLRREITSFQKINEFLGFADREIEAARFLSGKFDAEAYKSAYDALIHAGNALIRSYGYRPTTSFTHATITECTDRILGEQFSQLVGQFKRMRRKRHPLQYEAIFGESKEEVVRSIENAAALVAAIRTHIKTVSKDQSMF